MERIDERALSLMTQMAVRQSKQQFADCPLNGGVIVYHWGGGTVYQGGGRELTVC